MNKIHNIWAVICFFMSLAAFVAGRWFTPPDANQISQPSLATAEEQQAIPLVVKKTGSLIQQTSNATDSYGGKEVTKTPGAGQSMECNGSEPFQDIPPSLQPGATGTESTEVPAFPVLQPPPPEMITMEEKANEDLREALADSLRESGVPEDEIRLQLETQFPPAAPFIDTPPEQATDISPEQVVEEVAATLRESGLSEEEVDQATEGFFVVAQEATEEEQRTLHTDFQ